MKFHKTVPYYRYLFFSISKKIGEFGTYLNTTFFLDICAIIKEQFEFSNWTCGIGSDPNFRIPLFLEYLHQVDFRSQLYNHQNLN